MHRMNEEQLAWARTMINWLNDAVDPQGTTSYEQLVDKIQLALETCPEP